MRQLARARRIAAFAPLLLCGIESVAEGSVGQRGPHLLGEDGGLPACSSGSCLRCLSGAQNSGRNLTILGPDGKYGQAPLRIGRALEFWSTQAIFAQIVGILVSEVLGISIEYTACSDELRCFMAASNCIGWQKLECGEIRTVDDAFAANANGSKLFPDPFADLMFLPEVYRRVINANQHEFVDPNRTWVSLGPIGYTIADSLYTYPEIIERAWEQQQIDLQSYRAFTIAASKDFFDAPERLMRDGVRPSDLTCSSQVATNLTYMHDLEPWICRDSWLLTPACAELGDRWSVDCAVMLDDLWGFLKPDLHNAMARTGMRIAKVAVGANLAREIIQGKRYNITFPWWRTDTAYETKSPRPINMPMEYAPANDIGLKVGWQPAMHADGQLKTLLSKATLDMQEMMQLTGRLFNATGAAQNGSVAAEPSLYQEIACTWIREHPETWQGWLPTARDCAQGEFFSEGNRSCSPCPAGYIPSGAASCKPCEAGSYNDVPGSVECLACRPGRFSAEGSTICACPAGQEAWNGNGDCVSCKRGFFSEDIGDHCTSCATAKHVDAPFTSPPGAAGVSDCRPCKILAGGYCIPVRCIFYLLAVCLLPLSACGTWLHCRMHASALWKIERSELIFSDSPEILGRGTFGYVIKAEYRGTSVAVKRVIPPNLLRKPASRSAVGRPALWRCSDFGAGDVGAAPNAQPGFGVDMHGTPSKRLRAATFLAHLVVRLCPRFLLRCGGIPAHRPQELEAGSLGRVCVGQASPGAWSRQCSGLPGQTPKSLSNTSNALLIHAKLAADFIDEMKLLSKLRHPCVTTVMGAVVDNRSEPMLVLEFMEHGSLYDLLQNETVSMDSPLVLHILRDIAQGVRFLHAANPAIVHGDLKAQNVLVDAKFRAKVADFGLTQKQKVGAVGTPFWMAPELLRAGCCTPASDVYAFGVILVEVCSRGDPYHGQDPGEVLAAVAEGSREKRPEIPPLCPAELTVLMRECWKEDPSLRPSFQELDRRLKSMDAGDVDASPKMFRGASARKLRRADDLLHDVFPKHVADALRAGRKVEPEHKDLVTIFFSDIVGFTDISATLEAQKVSEMLHRLYSKFDALSFEYGVFKVETIGDAYMAVTNLVEDQAHDHAARIARFAASAIAAAKGTLVNEEQPEMGCVNIRVGFHSGPVVANVVGTRNRRYCLFGDTVNTASRMESNSARNLIHCSRTAAAFVKQQAPDISLTSRGYIRVKGKGEMETYWVGETPLTTGEDHVEAL